MKKREYFMEKKPARAIAVLPIGVFLVLYLGLGCRFEYVLKIEMGFYNIPIVAAFLAAILVACLQKVGWSPERTAAASGLDVLAVRALLAGTTPTVARLTQLRLAALLASLDLNAAGRSAA